MLVFVVLLYVLYLFNPITFVITGEKLQKSNSLNFRCKNIFVRRKNIRNYFTRNFCYNEYLENKARARMQCMQFSWLSGSWKAMAGRMSIIIIISFGT